MGRYEQSDASCDRGAGGILCDEVEKAKIKSFRNLRGDRYVMDLYYHFNCVVISIWIF